MAASPAVRRCAGRGVEVCQAQQQVHPSRRIGPLRGSAERSSSKLGSPTIVAPVRIEEGGRGVGGGGGGRERREGTGGEQDGLFLFLVKGALGASLAASPVIRPSSHRLGSGIWPSAAAASLEQT